MNILEKRHRTLRWLLLLALLSASTAVPAQPARTPEETAQRFYSWYLHALNQNEDPLEKQQAELSKFITQRLLRSLNRALRRPDGIDADFFIDAQDWDESWEKNISTSGIAIRGTQATVNVILKGGPAFGNKRLKLLLRREAGVWKIDGVNNRLNP